MNNKLLKINLLRSQIRKLQKELMELEKITLHELVKFDEIADKYLNFYYMNGDRIPLSNIDIFDFYGDYNVERYKIKEDHVDIYIYDKNYNKDSNSINSKIKQRRIDSKISIDKLAFLSKVEDIDLIRFEHGQIQLSQDQIARIEGILFIYENS